MYEQETIKCISRDILCDMIEWCIRNELIGHALAMQILYHDEFFAAEPEADDLFVRNQQQKEWMHRWQYWVYIRDDGGMAFVMMPLQYIYEMIFDWWIPFWETGDVYGVFSWYEDNCEHIKLHKTTRRQVEDILGQIRAKLRQCPEYAMADDE